MLVPGYAFKLFWNVLEKAQINNRAHEDTEHGGICRPTGAACACVRSRLVGHRSREMVFWRGGPMQHTKHLPAMTDHL